MQLSIRSLLLLCVYGGICSLNYAGSSLWIGTATVVATIALISYAAIYAFTSQRVFPLAFSIAASAWIIFWFGFFAETGPSYPQWPLPQDVHQLMGGRIDPGKGDPRAGATTYARFHSIYFSSLMAHYGPTPNVPHPLNLIRLAVCLMSLAVGLCAGIAGILLRNAKHAYSHPDAPRRPTI